MASSRQFVGVKVGAIERAVGKFIVKHVLRFSTHLSDIDPIGQNKILA